MTRRRYCLARDYGKLDKKTTDIPYCTLCCLYCGQYLSEHVGKLCGKDACKVESFDSLNERSKRKACMERGSAYALTWKRIVG